MTLEWLLIVAAVAGLAAGTVLAVQRVLDETTEVPLRPEVQLIDADVAAAHLVAEARATADVAPTPGDYDDSIFMDRCAAIGLRFSEVVTVATWEPNPWEPFDPDAPALPRCLLVPSHP